MKVVPLFDRVLLQRQEAPETTAGGLYIPDNAKEKPNYAKVVNVGPKVTQVTEGDIVLMSKYAGTDVKVDGEAMILVKEEDILAVVQQYADPSK